MNHPANIIIDGLNARDPMWWLWSILLLLNLVKASPSLQKDFCSSLDSPIENLEEFQERILELERFQGQSYPLQAVNALLKTFEAQRCAICICMNEKYFRALEFILLYRFDNLPQSTEKLRTSVFTSTMSVNDKDVWAYFFSANRMDRCFHPCGCIERRIDVLTSFIGTFSFQELAFGVYFNVFGLPMHHSVDVVKSIRGYVEGNRDFMKYSPVSILEGKFEMSVFFDMFSVMHGLEEVTAYPKLLQLISRFEVGTVNDLCCCRLQAPFREYFTAIQEGKSDVSSLLDLKFTSPVVIKAAQLHFGTEIGAFIKSLIFALVDCKGGQHLNGSYGEAVTRIVSEILAIHIPDNSPIIFYEFLLDIFKCLIGRACSDASEAELSVLDTISHSIYAITLHLDASTLLESCLTDGRLHGHLLYILAQFPSQFEALLLPHCTAATFAEVFAIPLIASRSLVFEPYAISSSLGRIIDPKAALQHILSSPKPSLGAIRAIFLMYVAETGAFELNRFSNPKRSVCVFLQPCGELQAIFVRITITYVIEETITQFLGFVNA